MSTTVLIILAILTAVSAVAALSIIRWREQQRLARARLMVELSDLVLQHHDAINVLHPWLSENSIVTLANIIQRANRQMAELQLSVNNKVKKAALQASEWIENPPMKKPSALPQDEPGAKQLRKALQLEIDLVKQAYQNRRLEAAPASALLRELRLLNVRLVVTVLLSKASAAISMNNPSSAELHLQKVIKTVKAIKHPNDEVMSLCQRATLMLDDIKQNKPQPSDNNRLAEAADQLAEEQDAWKKKHF